MAGVRHKILVLSGKGGVGKSTFTAHLAHGLATNEERQVYLSLSLSLSLSFSLTHSQVAVLDIDICGPSIPKLMGCEGEQVHQSGSGWSPVVTKPPFLPSPVLSRVPLTCSMWKRTWE